MKNDNSQPPAAGEAEHTPFVLGHRHEGGTGITNFLPDRAAIYREAIRRFGSPYLAVMDADFQDHGHKGHCSLHQIGGDAYEVLPMFWPVYDALKAEVEAIRGSDTKAVELLNAYDSDQRKLKALVEALKMQDTDIPYSRKLEWVFKGLKAAGGDMPSLKEIHALESRDALSEIAKWASEAAESERARVGANPDADAFVPSWLPELEAALNRAALALAKEPQ